MKDHENHLDAVDIKKEKEDVYPETLGARAGHQKDLTVDTDQHFFKLEILQADTIKMDGDDSVDTNLVHTEVAVFKHICTEEEPEWPKEESLIQKETIRQELIKTLDILTSLLKNPLLTSKDEDVAELLEIVKQYIPKFSIPIKGPREPQNKNAPPLLRHIIHNKRKATKARLSNPTKEETLAIKEYLKSLARK